MELIDQLDATLASGASDAFRAYLSTAPTDRYIIASDYCVGGSAFRNNSLVFTVIKGGDELLSAHEISVRLTADLKDRCPSDDEIEFLKDPRFFTFGVIQSGRGRLLTREQAIASIQYSLDLISSWPNAQTHQALIDRLVQLRQQSQGKGSSAPAYFVRMLVASTIAAWIATLIAREQSLDAIGWFSDRDNITTHSDGLVKYLFGASLNDQCIYRNVTFPRVYGSNQDDPDAEPGEAPWYDPYIRVPDHFAGPLADLNIGIEDGTPVEPRSYKYAKMFSALIADNPRFASIYTRGDRWPWAFSSIRLSLTPP